MSKMFSRGLSVILALVIAVGCMLSSSAVSGKYGDLNNDGKVNSSDALDVLKHSVGSKLLTGDNLVLGDVNADSLINSADALLVLQFAVGKISSFPAEGPSAPTTKADILAYYAQAVSKARADIPAYKLKLTSEVTKVDLSGSIVDGMTKEQVEQQKKDMMQKQSYTNLYKQGQASALSNLPSECKVTDPSAYKDVTCKVLEDGNYQIDLIFKDEKNPTTNSTIVKMLGLPDKKTVEKQVKDEFMAMFEDLSEGSESTDASSMMIVEIPTLEYKNCSISCVVNPETGEIVSYKITSDMKHYVNFKVVIDLSFTVVTLADMNTDTTTRTTFEYSNFVY